MQSKYQISIGTSTNAAIFYKLRATAQRFPWFSIKSKLECKSKSKGAQFAKAREKRSVLVAP
ncbi:MAG: hypothetical protein ACI8YQ_000822 [Polaribacter sp.]|jgi:hypothetical protein